MRLIVLWHRWRHDQAGVVLVFSALVLPLILLFGVIILQSGQLYIRQAELQFRVRQAANSGLMSVAQSFKVQAEINYQTQCIVDFPPSICQLKLWSDFLTQAEAQELVNQSITQNLVNAEIQDFLQNADPKYHEARWEVDIIFPYLEIQSHRVAARVELTEPQIDWIGNVLSSENYFLKVEALSYLNLPS